MRRLLGYGFTICILVSYTTSLISQESFWHRTHGPYGGSVFSMMDLPDGKLLIGTSDGIYSSNDSGEHWSASGLAAGDVRSLSILGRGELAAVREHQLFISSDRGGSWSPRSTFPLGISTFSTDGNGTAFVGSDSHLHRSTDAGQTWQSVTGAPFVYATSVLCAGDGLVLAGFHEPFDGGAAMKRSTDNGATWTECGLSEVWAVIQDSSGRLYAAKADKLYQSTDRGSTWRYVCGMPPAITDSYPAEFQFSLLAADGCSNLYVGSQNGALCRSSDQGTTWYFDRLAKSPLISIGFKDCRPGAIGTATVGMIRYDSVSGAWLPRNNGLGATSITSMASDATVGMFVATGGAVFRTTDRGDSWVSAIDSILDRSGSRRDEASYGALSLAISGQSVSVGTSHGIFLRSSEIPGRWTIAAEMYSPQQIQMIVGSSSGRFLALTDFTEGWSSENFGMSWFPRRDIANPFDRRVSSIGVDANGVWYTATHQHEVLSSTDDSETWQQLRPQLPLMSSYGTPLFQVAPWGCLLLFSRDGQLDVSSDQGHTWIERVPLRDSVFVSTAGPRNEVFVISGGALLRSTDDGERWDSLAPTIPGYSITRMLVTPDGFIYAGTDRGGVFVGSSRVSSIPEDLPKCSRESSALSIRPNPARTSITISFESQTPGPIRVSLISLLGETIRTTMEEAGSGPVTRSLSLDGLSDGIYVVRLEHGTLTEQRLFLIERK